MLKADKIVKDQAILRLQELSVRRKKDYKVPQGTGNTVTGTIFDCNRKKFEQMLKAYSDRLYIGWNPFKNEGLGCWELWHRPSVKTPTVAYDDGQLAIITMDYKPNDFEHWVDDLTYLSYNYIKKLSEMDAWNNKQLIQQTDEQIDAAQQKVEKEEADNIKYVVRHNKQAFRDLLDYTQAGFDPLQFFNKK